MKIRNGFVSNSSSSSFVVLIKAEEYDAKLNTVEEYVKEVMNYMTDETKDIFGTQCKVITYWTGNNDTFEYLETTCETPDEFAEGGEFNEGYCPAQNAFEWFLKDLPYIDFEASDG